MSSIIGQVQVVANTLVTYNVTPPALLDTQTAGLQGNSEADLFVVLNALGGLAGQALMAASLPVVIASDQTPLPENLVKIAGVAVLAGNGVTGPGSQRVTIASDNTPYQVKILDSAGLAISEGQQLMAASLPVVFASDQTPMPDNLVEIGGVAVLVGNGVTGPGSQRVTIASDNTAFPVKIQDSTGAAITEGQQLMAASLPVVIASDQSNLPENLVQIGGVAVLTGNGVTGAGSQRVTIASDNTAFPVKIQDSTGAAIALGQALMAASLPVTIASDQTWTGALNLGKAEDIGHVSGDVGVMALAVRNDANAVLTTTDLDYSAFAVDSSGRLKLDPTTSIIVVPTTLTVIDQIDVAVGPVLDTTVNPIAGNAGAFLELVASTAAATKKIRIADTTGFFIGVYTGAAGFEVLSFIINPGQSNEIEIAIPIATRISVRAMAFSAIGAGELCMQFQG